MATEAELGRAPGADLRDGVPTFPILLAAQTPVPFPDGLPAGTASGKMSAGVEESTSFNQQRDLCVPAEAIELCTVFLAEWIRSTKHLLRSLPPSPAEAARESLLALTEQMSVQADLLRRRAQGHYRPALESGANDAL